MYKVLKTLDLPCRLSAVGTAVTATEHEGHAHDAEFRVSEDGKHLEVVVPLQSK